MIEFCNQYNLSKIDDPVRTQTHRNPVGLRFYRSPGLRNVFFRIGQQNSVETGLWCLQ